MPSVVLRTGMVRIRMEIVVFVKGGSDEGGGGTSRFVIAVVDDGNGDCYMLAVEGFGRCLCDGTVRNSNGRRKNSIDN